jgi:hypothetical protein
MMNFTEWDKRAGSADPNVYTYSFALRVLQRVVIVESRKSSAILCLTLRNVCSLVRQTRVFFIRIATLSV